jgi:hypothetical protein
MRFLTAFWLGLLIAVLAMELMAYFESVEARVSDLERGYISLKDLEPEDNG